MSMRRYVPFFLLVALLVFIMLQLQGLLVAQRLLIVGGIVILAVLIAGLLDAGKP